MEKRAAHSSRPGRAWLVPGLLLLGALLLAAVWLPTGLLLSGEPGAALAPDWRRRAILWCLLASAAVLAAVATLWWWMHRRHLQLMQLETAAVAHREAITAVRTMANSLPALIAYVNQERRYTFANGYYQRLLETDPAGMVGLTVQEARSVQTYARVAPYLDAAFAGRQQTFEVEVRRGDRTIVIQHNYIPDLAADGAVRGVYAMGFDVTALHEARQRLAAQERRLRGIADNLPVIITYINHNQCVEFANETNREWLGLAPEQILGKSMREIWGAEIYAQRQPYLERALRGERVQFQVERDALGTTRFLQNAYIPELGEDGQVLGVYMLGSDISELKAVERQLSTLARVDSLTGLANRRQFDEKLSDALARAIRSGEALALMFLDIDHFKAINDQHGHAAGDEVLKEFAKRLRQCVRGTDTVARLAGDEFVVLLEGVRHPSEPELVASKMVAQMRQPFTLNTQALQVTTSIGVAFRSGAAAGAEVLLAQADAALYAAKAAGRDTYRLAAPS